jgi:hypothetical protein
VCYLEESGREAGAHELQDAVHDLQDGAVLEDDDAALHLLPHILGLAAVKVVLDNATADPRPAENHRHWMRER